MPDLYLGKAVSNGDRYALASRARNRLQSHHDDRCQDSLRHFSFVAEAALSASLLLSARSGSDRLVSTMPAQSGKEGSTNRAAIDLLVATSAHRVLAAFC